MGEIKKILMKRDGLTSHEADDLISEAIEALNSYLMKGDTNSAEYICEEYFGLEPDYIDELI